MRLYFVTVVDVDEQDPTFVHTMEKQERLERIVAVDIQHVVNDLGYTGHVHVLPSYKCPNSDCVGVERRGTCRFRANSVGLDPH